METEKLVIDVDLPESFEKYDSSAKKTIIQYLNQLSSNEQMAYKIAKDHLGSSFNILRSNGFQDWKKKQPST
uniref:Uncharacterized protein n=1 Tax=viral metagenome TaxID=1070528 RepID=A0A6C0F4R3_9ZZZZ